MCSRPPTSWTTPSLVTEILVGAGCLTVGLTIVIRNHALPELAAAAATAVAILGVYYALT